jgi:hypothetical protein
MADTVTLELAIDTKDEDTLRAIEDALSDVAPERWPDTREIVTIIAIVSSAITLVNALLDLKKRLSKEVPSPPSIVIRNADRVELTLPNATEETLRALIEDSES